MIIKTLNNIFKRGLFNFLIVAFIFFILEAVSLVALFAQSGFNVQHFTIHRLVKSGVHGDGYGGNDANNLGLCSARDNLVQQGAHPAKVLVLGGSAASGTPEQNWPDKLWQHLELDYPHTNFEVINAGMGGATSSRELFLLSRLIHLKPDIVIIYNGWNDLYYSHYASKGYEKYHESRRDAVYDLEDRIKFFLERNSAFFCYIQEFKRFLRAKNSSNDSELSEASHVLGFSDRPIEGNPGNVTSVVYDFYGIKEPYFVHPPQPVVDRVSEIYRRNLEAMLKLCQDKKIKTVVVTQPSLMDYRISRNEQLRLPAEMDMTLHKFQDWQETVRILYPVIKHTAQELSTQYGAVYYDFIDVFGPMQDASHYFTDDVHQTTEGKVLLARTIKRILESEGYLSDKLKLSGPHNGIQVRRALGKVFMGGRIRRGVKIEMPYAGHV